ncbi:unnamed protein product, partial [Effrenium voratum]
ERISRESTPKESSRVASGNSSGGSDLVTMGESHAYGASLCCFSRRHFILTVCLVMTLVYAVRVLRWILLASLYFDTPRDHPNSCVGQQCFEVFSCYGMKDTTAHVIEPLFSLSGLLLFPLGFHAAMHGGDLDMKRFSLFMLATSLLRCGALVFDVTFFYTCNMYDSNMMSLVLSRFLPPSPLRLGVQETLAGFDSFPKEAVGAVTSFNILAWYLVLMGLWTAFFIYVTMEAFTLSSLMQHGLLGLGVHFGLDQWDEELNRAAIRRKAQSGVSSKFMDDAVLPLSQHVHVGGLSGYGAPSYAPRNYAYAGYDKDMSMTTDFSTGPPPSYEVPDHFSAEEEDAEAVRMLAERLAREESAEEILDRTWD